MTWNYRIIHYRNGGGYGLQEVFYDADGEPWGMASAEFNSHEDEGPDAVIGALYDAIDDGRQREVLEEPETWPGKGPAIPSLSAPKSAPKTHKAQ